MADLLAALTPAESDRLWWRIVRAMAAVADEIECLTLAPERVRDMLYGEGCLASYQGMLADLADLADTDLNDPTADWKYLLADAPEEGTPRWHDSEAQTANPRPVSLSLAMRISLRRAWRRLTPPRPR